MRLDVITLFPEFVNAVIEYGVTGRAVTRGLLELNTWNPRDYAQNRHNSVDERAYGGGPGMVMQIGPLRRSLAAARAKRVDNVPVIVLSPQGERFDQAFAQRLSEGPGAILISGRYEGIDERFVQSEVDFELSTGDYVLSGGELPAMIVVDALARLVPGVLGTADSATQDSFSDGLLEYPQYTRPEVDSAGRVPEVLLSGDHAAIARWRLAQALRRTWLRRPELLEALDLSAQQRNILEQVIRAEVADLAAVSPDA